MWWGMRSAGVLPTNQPTHNHMQCALMATLFATLFPKPRMSHDSIQDGTKYMGECIFCVCGFGEERWTGVTGVEP